MVLRARPAFVLVPRAMFAHSPSLIPAEANAMQPVCTCAARSVVRTAMPG
ncbi:MAG TPA: hypothetical protein VGB15_09840 [Longimicrobium sp.]